MHPILYPSHETAFDSNGLGILPDAARCIVTEERNGLFELELDYPISGLHYADIKLRSLIVAKPNPVDSPQPFRVYRITRPMGGMVTVYAQHLSYDLAGITVSPFAANSAAAAMAAFTTYAAGDCPFSFWTDKQSSAAMTVKAPESIRALLGGQQGSVLDCYGGEYKFDRYQVRLYGRRGADRGVTIRYGKNLTSLEQDENCAAVYTGVHPFWLSSEGDKFITLPEKILPAPGTYGFTRIKPLDLSGEWQEAPAVAQLRARAQQYMQENDTGVPKVSLEVSFVQLEQMQEYADKALLERVELCDTVRIEFPALGVSAAAKVNQTVYDVLRGRYESVCLGDARGSIADTIIQQGQEIKRSAAETKTALQQAVDNATSLITGNAGGYVVLHSSSGQKQPDEILIMDKPKIADAVKIWRWNKQGLGYSSHGYNGPYGLAMTADGAIVADFITTGSLNAALVKIGEVTLTSVLNGMETRVASAEGKATTVQQTLEGLTLSAVNSKDNTSSTLKLTSGGTELTSADINLNGLVSFNNLSSTDPNNKTTINGSLITTGKIQSKNGKAYIDLSNNQISWDSRYSKMTNEGKLSCQSADISGDLFSGDSNQYWIKLSSNGEKEGTKIAGGYGQNEYGYINYAAEIKNISTGELYYGMHVRGEAIVIATDHIAVKDIHHLSSSSDNILASSGSIEVITEVLLEEDHNGNLCLSVKSKPLHFANGLLVTDLDSYILH